MTTPAPQELKVVRSELGNAAHIWDAQASAIGSISPKAEGLRLDRLEAGVFQLIAGPYGQVVDQVSGRCTEGRTNMGDIANALRTASQSYAKTEQQNTQAAQGVH